MCYSSKSCNSRPIKKGQLVYVKIARYREQDPLYFFFKSNLNKDPVNFRCMDHLRTFKHDKELKKARQSLVTVHFYHANWPGLALRTVNAVVCVKRWCFPFCRHAQKWRGLHGLFHFVLKHRNNSRTRVKSSTCEIKATISEQL